MLQFILFFTNGILSSSTPVFPDSLQGPLVKSPRARNLSLIDLNGKPSCGEGWRGLENPYH